MHHQPAAIVPPIALPDKERFALQRILGHESLTMVNNYLAIAQTDIQAAHNDASPVTNWLL